MIFHFQAEFSFVLWPFSLKLFWAPIVDAIYSQRFGRRKTWLIPVQYTMGLFMLYLSVHVQQWMNDSQAGPSIGLLTVLFFSLNVLAATQDIVVDGWALTMLKRNNVGYASTCNSVGQTAGYFLGYVLFMALESAEFCNAYLRSTPATEGLITLPGKFIFLWFWYEISIFIQKYSWFFPVPGFLYFWGWAFMVCTTIVAICKRETDEKHSQTNDLWKDVKHSYSLLWATMKLPTIKMTALILLTSKVMSINYNIGYRMKNSHRKSLQDFL